MIVRVDSGDITIVNGVGLPEYNLQLGVSPCRVFQPPEVNI